VTTASLDTVDFLSGIRAGDIMILTGRLNAAFRTSMEIEVEVHAEDPYTGTHRLTTRALLTMVALDRDLKPRSIPGIAFEDDAERRRSSEAQDRRRERLARRPRAR
jgi:acyl-CoA hydrolase